MTIAIIDYGMGNLRSVEKALQKVGGTTCVTRKPAEIRAATKVVFPGVGAIGNCMAALRKYRLIGPLLEAIEADKPFLGICLGFQSLFTESYEFGRHQCLGIFPGKVVKFKLPKKYAVPHMGWNQVVRVCPTPYLQGIPSGTAFYFVHSYYVVPRDPKLATTTTDYGGEFVSSIARGNLFACQFHPEKSQEAGLKLLKNFVEL